VIDVNNTQILHNKDITPINKVYNIARNLRANNRISSELWYAILELKDERLNEIKIIEQEDCNILDQQLSLTSKQFKSILKKLLGDDEKQLSFEITKDKFYANYRPKYPEESAADMTVIVNHWNGTGEIRGNLQSLIPTIKKYNNLRDLFNEIKHMERE
jgi:hypothetical protein